jgi:hypothetical protein
MFIIFSNILSRYRSMFSFVVPPFFRVNILWQIGISKGGTITDSTVI